MFCWLAWCIGSWNFETSIAYGINLVQWEVILPNLVIGDSRYNGGGQHGFIWATVSLLTSKRGKQYLNRTFTACTLWHFGRNLIFIQVLILILTPFSTRSLLPLMLVSHRLCALILSILHSRLRTITRLKGYRIELECFRPSSKYIEPQYFCKYLGTIGVSDKLGNRESQNENFQRVDRLGKLTAHYIVFRPEPKVDERGGWRSFGLLTDPSINGRRVDVDSPSVRDCGSGIFSKGVEETPKDTPERVRRVVHLERFQYYTQLCIIVNLVRIIPNTTCLMTTVNIQNGAICLARDWLEYSSNSDLITFSLDKAGAQEEKTNTHGRPCLLNRNQDIVWVDKMQSVGLKVRVKRGRYNRPMPFVDESLHCEVEIEGMLYLFPSKGGYTLVTVNDRSPRSICLSNLCIWGISERTKLQFETNSHGCLPTRPICRAMVKNVFLSASGFPKLLYLFLSGRFSFILPRLDWFPQWVNTMATI